MLLLLVVVVVLLMLLVLLLLVFIVVVYYTVSFAIGLIVLDFIDEDDDNCDDDNDMGMSMFMLRIDIIRYKLRCLGWPQNYDHKIFTKYFVNCIHMQPHP